MFVVGMVGYMVVIFGILVIDIIFFGWLWYVLLLIVFIIVMLFGMLIGWLVVCIEGIYIIMIIFVIVVVFFYFVC